MSRARSSRNCWREDVMADRESFLQAIREAPEDDALRLVFADWLDEQDDLLGQFIRLQFELEPIRDNYQNPHAAELRQREEQFLRDHEAFWIGPPLEGLMSSDRS